MNTFLTQPKGSTSREPNKQAIARIFGLKQSAIAYLNVGASVDGYSIIYEKATQTTWFTRGATGTVISYVVGAETLTLTTSTGIFKLYVARAVGIDYLFKNEQHLQFYYDALGNWDDAIFTAQVNVYLKGYSPKIILPVAEIITTRPILNGPALGDAIHAAYPELNFYNSSTGKYLASWPLVLHGTYRKQQDGGTGGLRGTQLNFRGCANRADMTWTKWAIIHSAPNPDEVGQLRRTDAILKDWPAYAELKDFNIRAINKDGVAISNIHGLYFHYGTQVTVSNMSIYQCYGAGVAVDNTWDSKFDNLKIIQCGRMSPLFGQYITEGNLGAQYQTYAPIHVMRSPLTDNSNYIRFIDCHVEDNLHAAVDVIVSGNSAPVWLERFHVEAMTSLGGTAAGNDRYIVGCGNFGVTYWGQEAQAGYDYKARPDTGTGGYVSWHGGGMYSQTYSRIASITRFSGLVISDMVFPNSGDIYVNGGNQSPYVYLSNVVCRDIVYAGGNGGLSSLKMANCKASSISMDYTYGPQLVNVDVSGAVSFTNMFSNNVAGGAQFTNCNFGSLQGLIQYASGNVTLNSTTVKSSFVVYNGHIDISRYAYYIATNLVGG